MQNCLPSRSRFLHLQIPMCRIKLFWVFEIDFGYFEEKDVGTIWITRLRAPSCGLVLQIVFLFLF